MSAGSTFVVTKKVSFAGAHKARRLCPPDEPRPQPSPGAGRVPRVARLMALAIHYEQLMRAGAVKTQAEIAGLAHVTRARVTQIMNMLHLAPDIQEAILFLPPTASGHDPIKEGQIRPIAADGQGRMRAGPLAEALKGVRGPVIVAAQAGNVNSGAFDPLEEIAGLTAERGAWLHVDGAFGLWAAVSADLEPLVAGAGRADSWATDAHKWLNVPYDCGIVAVAHPAAHRAAMGLDASYLGAREDERRNGQDWVPELSRRGRGVPVYAVIRALGREGVVEMVERSCSLARRMAKMLDGQAGARVVNEVALNQVLIRFEPPGRDADAFTREVIARVQADGTCWLGGARWKGMEVMRISIVNWSTTEADVDRSAAAILRCAAAG